MTLMNLFLLSFYRFPLSILLLPPALLLHSSLRRVLSSETRKIFPFNYYLLVILALVYIDILS